MLQLIACKSGHPLGVYGGAPAEPSLDTLTWFTTCGLPSQHFAEVLQLAARPGTIVGGVYGTAAS